MREFPPDENEQRNSPKKENKFVKFLIVLAAMYVVTILSNLILGPR